MVLGTSARPSQRLMLTNARRAAVDARLTVRPGLSSPDSGLTISIGIGPHPAGHGKGVHRMLLKARVIRMAMTIAAVAALVEALGAGAKWG